MTTDPLRLDLIIRTSERKKDARSPQQQIDIAQACADVNNYEIVKTHDSGKSESGKTMDRTSVNDAMARVRDGKTDGVIVALTDRLGRAPIEEAMATVRELNKIGGKFIPADAGGRPVDLSDPQAETMLVLQLQIGRQFWLTKAQGFKRSQADAIKRGAFIGRVPLGYLRPHKGMPLVIDPKTAPIVRETFKRAGSGGLHAAMEYLAEQVPDRRWRTDEARALLNNRVYLGESRSGELINDRAHKPLVTATVFEAAQTEPRHRRSNGDYVLSHLANCEKCGSGLVGALQTVRGVQYRRMRCSNPACKGGTSISADKLEWRVREWAKQEIGSPTFRVKFDHSSLHDAEQALEDAEAERKRFATDLEMRDILGDAAWREGAQARKTAVDEARDHLRSIASESALSERVPAADELDDDEGLLCAIRLLAPSIVVRPGRVAKRIVINGDAD